MSDEIINGQLEEVQCRTIKQMLLYKMDRTLAVIGVVVLGAWGLYVGTDASTQVTMAAIGGLVVYLGVKGK
jgi:type IV secretory pathway VirB2 component (pilin)